MDIQNVFLLVAAVIERAQTDSDMSQRRHTTTDLPRTCTATANDHPARDCAIAFLAQLKPLPIYDGVDVCFEVAELWQQ